MFQPQETMSSNSRTDELLSPWSPSPKPRPPSQPTALCWSAQTQSHFRVRGYHSQIILFPKYGKTQGRLNQVILEAPPNL